MISFTHIQADKDGQRYMEKKKHDTHAIAIIAALLGHVIWGLGYIFTRVALRHASPEIILSHRFIVAFFIMNMLILMGKGSISIKGKNLKPLLLLMIIEPVYFYFESYGIYHTNATFSGVVLAVIPIVAMVLAIFMLKEYPSKRQALFSILPVAGVILMTISGSEMGIIKFIGVVFLILTCFSSALYKIYNRKSSVEFSSFERTYAILLVCVVFYTFEALRTNGWDIKGYVEPLMNMEFVLSILFLSIFCSFLSNLFCNYAAARLPVMQFSAFGATTTLATMIVGILFLKEPFSAMSLIGSALVLIGVWQVTKPEEDK